MDAAQFSKKVFLFIAAGLVLAASGRAADLQVSSSNISLFLTPNDRATVHVTSSDGATPISFTATIAYTPGEPATWLGLPSLGTTTVTATTPADLNIAVVNTLISSGPGPYHATVNLANNSGGAAAAVSIVYSPTQGTGLSTTPSAVGTISYQTATGVSQSQQVTVNGVSTYNSSTSTSWITLTAGGQTAQTLTGVSGPLTISPIPSVAATLATGSYQGSVSITSGGSTVNLAINLTVNGGSTTGSLVVSPASLAFATSTTVASGASVPSQALVISAPVGSTFTIATDQPWIQSVYPQAGTIPATLSVRVDRSGLAASATPYTGNITISSPAATSAVIPVAMLVSDSRVLWTSPAGAATFTIQNGVASPTLQQLSFSMSDGSAVPALTLTSFPNWVTATLTGNVLTITPSASQLTGGVYSDVVVITSPTVANSPLSIPVIAMVTSASGQLTFSSPSFSFQGTVSGSTPAAQNLTVTTPTGTSFTASSNSAWLKLSPSGTFTSSQTFSVSVDPTGLGASTYNGALVFVSNGVTQTVPVTFTLASGTGGNVTVDKSSLSFTAQVGAAPPAGQAVVVSNAVSGTAGIAYTVSVSPANSWLSVDKTSATTQSTITVSVNHAGLSAGNYTGTVTVTPTGGTAVPIAVALTVQPVATVGVSTSTLSFSYRGGSDTPAAQTVHVTSSGTSLTFSATASSTGNWLQVTPSSGSTPADVSVSVNPATLTPGTYQGTITVAGTGGAAGSNTINVTLTVTPPLPTITRLGNAGSYVGGSIAPGEIITIIGTDLGPTTAFQPQLDAAGKLATTVSNVQVLVNGFPAPLVNGINTQVSAIVPYEIARNQAATILVKYLGQTSNAVTVPVAVTAPGIFTHNSSGTGSAAYDVNFHPVNSGNAVAKRGAVVFYLTGEGQTSPAGVTGAINPNSFTLPTPLLPVAVLIDGQPANWTYAGGVPQIVEGLMQLNVQIPNNARSGDLPVVVTIGSNSSQSGVTVSVQ